MDYQLLLISVITGAFIGWLTNLVAVKMLFHPRRPFYILGLRIQGVFPLRQHELAEKVGEIVSSELFTVDDVTGRITAIATSPEAISTLSSKIQAAAYHRLISEVPLLGRVLKEEHLKRIVKKCLPDLRELVFSTTNAISSQIHGELDVHTLVRDKVRDYSSEELEEVVYDIMRKEFKFIELVGAVLGGLIGLIQPLAMYFMN